MPRPRSIRDEDLLASTARIVERDGPLTFTLQAVAEDAGVTAPLLIQRFENKRGLLLALANTGAANVDKAFETAGRTPLTKLENALIALVQPATPRSIAHGLSFLQLDVTDPEFRTAALHFFDRFRDLTKKALDDAIQAKELRRCDTAALARTLETAYNGSILTWALRQEGTIQKTLTRDINAVLAPYRSKV